MGTSMSAHIASLSSSSPFSANRSPRCRSSVLLSASGTELGLLAVRQHHLSRVKDCKALAGEYVTIQHNPVVVGFHMKKWKEKRIMGPNNIKWFKGKDNMNVEYRERVRRK